MCQQQKGSERWLISQNIFQTSIFSTEIPIHIPARTIRLWENDGSVRATYDRASLCCQKILPGHHSVVRFWPRVVIRNRQWRKSKWHLAGWRQRIRVVIVETRRKIRPLDYISRETPVMRLRRSSLRDSRTRVRRRPYYKTPLLPRVLLYVIAKYDNPR